MLLNFTVRNHKSLKDETTLELVKRTLKTLKPSRDSSWRDHVLPVVGVFGANASGKSTVIDAIHYAISAIGYSASSWLDSSAMRRVPFALDEDSRSGTSEYEFDFVRRGVRHLYGFELGAQGIVREWLRDVPTSRWRTLMERTAGQTVPKTHSSVGEIGPVAARELALSRALRLGNSVLAPIARSLTQDIGIIPFGEKYRDHRLNVITTSLVQQQQRAGEPASFDFGDIETLLQMADVGILSVDLREDAVPPETLEFLAQLRKLLYPEESGGEASAPGELPQEAVDEVIHGLEFTHRGPRDQTGKLAVDQESEGTKAWLALAVPALSALREGTVLVADELDASLHPHLVQLLIGFFNDPEFNANGAQLIFTSHDAFVLSPLNQETLAPEQVWFTEKDHEGVSTLYSLSDFPRHADANIARRYLAGRYGAVPSPTPHSILRLLETDRVEVVG